MPEFDDGREYATHLPILEGFCNLATPARILEFGTGIHSTNFFLTRRGVRKVVSVERHPRWYDRFAESIHDRRLDLVRSGPSDLAGFDLVFIDDGRTPEDRERTIRWVLGQPHPPVIVHDAEVKEYGAAIRELAPGRSTLFCIDTPNTAVIWPEGWEHKRYELGMEVSRCVS